ncbi:MAG: M20/M25/M40 family metallo-hydrolase [Anaerolineae bacterium]|nr:M20/M25/M40 family metallo-hydrolase [Anaerolineae bacterium]
MRILKQLSEVMGVSGEEGEVRKIVLDLVRPHVDEIRTDTMGNILALKHGTAEAPRLVVQVDAHMDEVGLMVTGHTGSGMLKVSAIGGLDDRILPGLRVLVGSKRLPGVIGGKPVHLSSGSDREHVTALKDLTVDIGVTSKGAAEGKAPAGTRIGFESRFIDLGTMARGKAFDDRVGCAVLVHVLQGECFPFDLAATFTVQEEIGVRGAGVAAYAARPTAAFVLEGTVADDLPREEDSSSTTIPGNGPALSVMDHGAIYDRRLNDLLVRVAAEQGIPVQFKQPGVGGTNARSIQLSREGVPVACVAVPCRYIHSPAALLNKSDYHNAVSLMRAALNNMQPLALSQ